MSVSEHLGIRLAEYDERIRTFIPDYDEFLDAAAQALHALPTSACHIIDAGSGTGALAARCLDQLVEARVTAMDADAGMLDLARRRLEVYGERASTIVGNFLTMAIPTCHAITGSLTFHHVRTSDRKREMYRAFRRSLLDDGLLILADCCPSEDERLAARERDAWRAHLRETYADPEIDEHFATWSREDVYFPLGTELDMLADASFHTEVVWRRGAFAVLAARCR
jgi:ubiquinone/menaquinone biosynthesis C-methylase UbiE